MDLSFSQRKGILPIKKELQIDSIDDDLRIAIWNVLLQKCLRKPRREDYLNRFFKELWDKHFKLPIDEIPTYYQTRIDFIKKRYMRMKYNQVYDLLEFILSHFPSIYKEKIEECVDDLNCIFEREFCGYRLIDGHITEITSKIEIVEIEKAIKTPLMTANEHIRTAHEHLSDRNNPDYRNSIKESISAVESICKKIANDPKTTMGKALNVIETKEKIQINSDMKEAFKKLYNYTSDSNGIRHSLTDQNRQPNFDDAKFMLVSCSAFVNYLVSKANKARISLM